MLFAELKKVINRILSVIFELCAILTTFHYGFVVVNDQTLKIVLGLLTGVYFLFLNIRIGEFYRGRKKEKIQSNENTANQC